MLILGVMILLDSKNKKPIKSSFLRTYLCPSQSLMSLEEKILVEQVISQLMF